MHFGNVILSFLVIRFRQLGRMLSDIGLIRFLIIAIFGTPLLIILVTRLFFDFPSLGLGLALIGVVSLQIYRKDRPFLEAFFRGYRYAICFVEYLLIAFPILLVFCIGGHPMHAMILGIGLYIVPCLKGVHNQLKWRPMQLKIIPDEAFELKAGFRSYYLVLLLLIALGITFAKFIYVPLVCTFALSVALVSNQLACESLVMIIVFSSSPQGFLYRKIRYQVLFALLLYLPVAIAFLYFHGNYWYEVLAVSIMGIILQALAVCLKYALYQPGLYLRGNQLLLAGAAACFVIVFLAPVPLIMLIRYYIKAKANLKHMLC